MRQVTLEVGYFTVADIAEATDTPRSTVQDWVNRLIEEGCVILTEGQRGRHAARYAASSAMPESACRRVFTTIDGNEVEIYHECMSGGCAAFCEFHHARAGGPCDRSAAMEPCSGSGHSWGGGMSPSGSTPHQRSVSPACSARASSSTSTSGASGDRPTRSPICSRLLRGSATSPSTGRGRWSRGR
ncbi:MAG: helix-turn-helix domain-containing protein [Methanoculleus sp.]